jgi:putative aldouronate transport system substrate-binding protein
LYASVLLDAPKSLILNGEETEIQKAKTENLNTYMEQKISEFIAGRTPINDDTLKAFVDQCVKLGAYELRDMYNANLKRVYGEQ